MMRLGFNLAMAGTNDMILQTTITLPLFRE